MATKLVAIKLVKYYSAEVFAYSDCNSALKTHINILPLAKAGIIVTINMHRHTRHLNPKQFLRVNFHSERCKKRNKQQTQQDLAILLAENIAGKTSMNYVF